VVRVALGAAGAAAVAIVLAALIIPLSAWPEWLGKVSRLNADPHANHVSLRTLIAGSPSPP